MNDPDPRRRNQILDVMGDNRFCETDQLKRQIDIAHPESAPDFERITDVITAAVRSHTSEAPQPET